MLLREGDDGVADLAGLGVKVVGGLADQAADQGAVRLVKAAGGDGGGAQAQAGGDEGLLRVVGDGVLVGR